MASSGSFNTSDYEGRYLMFLWSVQSQSVVTNQTKISWQLVGAGSAESSYYKAGNFKVVIDGSTVYSSTTRINLYSGTVVASGTYTLTHDSSGNKSFTASAQAGIYTYAVNCTGSDSFTLPQIARTSTINSVTGSKISDTYSVSYTEYATSFTNNLLISLSGGSTLQTITDYETGEDFTLSDTLKSAIYTATASSKTTVLSFKLATYSGSTLVGTSSAINVTVTVDDSTPTLNSISYVDSNSTTVAITGDNQYIIRNNSNLKVTASSMTAYNGATLTSLSVNFAGVTTTIDLSGTTLSSQIINVGTVNLSSDATLTVTLTDSRGYTAVKTTEVLIYDWVAPTAVISCARENNYYTDTYLLVNASYASLGGNNELTIKAYTKESTASSYGSAIDVTNNTSVTLSLDNTTSWNVKVVLTDKLGSTTYIIFVDRGQPIIYFDRIKSSVGINCFPSNTDSLEVNGIDIIKALYYQSGDTETINGLVTCGLLTSSSTKLRISIPLRKSYADLTPSVTSLNMYLRGINGVMTQYSEVVGASGFSITNIVTTDNILTLDIDNTNGYNIDTDTPVAVSIYSTITFT